MIVGQESASSDDDPRDGYRGKRQQAYSRHDRTHRYRRHGFLHEYLRGLINLPFHIDESGFDNVVIDRLSYLVRVLGRSGLESFFDSLPDRDLECLELS